MERRNGEEAVKGGTEEGRGTGRKVRIRGEREEGTERDRVKKSREKRKRDKLGTFTIQFISNNIRRRQRQEKKQDKATQI